jgi:hypothetical protein
VIAPEPPPGVFARRFWRDLAERVIASAAGGALAVLIPGETMGDHHVSWTAVLLGAGVAALVSLLKGLVAGTTGNKDSASLTV